VSSLPSHLGVPLLWHQVDGWRNVRLSRIGGSAVELAMTRSDRCPSAFICG